MRYFRSCLIDDTPSLLEKSYHLRYQVYCLERNFLRPEDYPNKLESDEFDPYSLHFGVLNADSELVGTARVVPLSPLGLPMYRYCKIFPHQRDFLDSTTTVAEVSRLSVSRDYHRRAGDGPYGEPAAVGSSGNTADRRGSQHMVVNLYRAIYQTSKRMGITHLLAATERSLHRLLTRCGFPFKIIGPEEDYFGPVAPYIMDLADLDRVISERRVATLDDFWDGLEPEFWPQSTDIEFV
jgi:N-acyl amino acid synthase of PEP-CTERM/exosortase system